jgi:hypothetical protein
MFSKITSAQMLGSYLQIVSDISLRDFNLSQVDVPSLCNTRLCRKVNISRNFEESYCLQTPGTLSQTHSVIPQKN